MSRPQDDFWLGVQIAVAIGCVGVIVWLLVIAFQRETPEERIEAKLDRVIAILSDLHAERAKPQ